MSVRGAAFVGLLLVAIVGTGPAFAEPVLLDEVARGVVPVTTETGIRVEGFHGEVRVRAGKPGEMRYFSGEAEDQRAELPVALWLDGSTLVLRPTAAAADRAHFVEMSVPEALSVSARLTDAKFFVRGIARDADIVGERLEAEAVGIGGGVRAEIEGGTVSLQAVSGDASVQGSDLAVKLAHLAGQAYLRVTGGSVTAENLQQLETDLEDVALAVELASEPMLVRAQGGRAKVSGLRKGGEFLLQGTPLDLVQCEGDITAEFDSDVQFRDSKASLHFDGYGGSVRGLANEGLLEVKTHNAEVILENITGPLRVQGDGLTVRLKDLKSETIVYTTGSRIDVEGVAGPVHVENDFGDVSVSGAKAKVEVRSRDGDVRLDDLGGPVDLVANGSKVDVAWKTLPSQEDSSIRNEGGDVSVRFPGNASCRVEAKAEYGRIESELPQVRVLDGATEAQGVIGRGGGRTVRIESAGDVVLLGPAGH